MAGMARMEGRESGPSRVVAVPLSQVALGNGTSVFEAELRRNQHSQVQLGNEGSSASEFQRLAKPRSLRRCATTTAASASAAPIQVLGSGIAVRVSEMSLPIPPPPLSSR